MVVAVIASAWWLPPWVVLVAGLLLGLPHGAVDHLVPRWLLGSRAPQQAAVVLAYAATALTAYVAFGAWPVAAVTLFLLVSAWHFGSGEVGFSDLRAGRALPARRVRGVVHVAVVLALPALLRPDGVLPLLGAVVGADIHLGATTGVAATVAAGLLAGAAAVFAAAEFANGRRTEALDLVLLLALVALVSPLAAFGAYFGGWHSVRHVARTVEDDPSNADDLAAGRLSPALRRLARLASAPTLAALTVVAVLVVSTDGWSDFASEYLPLLAGLTVPHLVVVAWADRHRAPASASV